MMGYRDSGPYKSGVAWADPVAGMHAVSAIVIALADREADPERRGQSIELAQYEGMICFIGEEIIGTQLRGGDPPRRGNRDAYFAPQGCYACAGDDRWLALTVTGDEEWKALCGVAGFGDRWASLGREERMARHDEIDGLIAAWTATLDRDETMRRLQHAGIAACSVFDARDLVENEHLAARGFFANVTHPDAGTHLFPGLPVRLSENPATYRRPAPGLGEHNEEILVGLLGLSIEEVAALREKGVIAEEPPL
jgi:crotonobetainyl-CoA:carnitine CoA-transferase CaiB-like acyl-CoA transferase